MRKIFHILVLSVTVATVNTVFAQNEVEAPSRRTVVVQGNKNVPPPAPLIYKAPEKSELKEFVSEDKTFQITFAGVPKITRQEVKNGTVTTYLVYRQGSDSIVNAADFDVDIESGRETIYRSIRNDFLKTPKTTIKAEKDVKINGESGKEFDVLQDYQYQKIRILIIGTRLYEIKSDITNWHIAGDLTKKQFFSETENFFNSFSHIKLPEKVVLQVPEGFLGAATTTSYKNTFFNFALDFPKDWHHFNEKEIEAGRKGGLELLKTEKEKTNKAFEEATRKETVIFAIAQRNTGIEKVSNLAAGVLRLPDNQTGAETLLLNSKNVFLTNPKIKLVKDIEEIDINGTRFSTITIETNFGDNNIINQKILTTIRKGYSLTFVLTYFNPDGLKSLEKIVESLNFNVK